MKVGLCLSGMRCSRRGSACIERGYQAARQCLPEIKERLQEASREALLQPAF